MSMPVNFILRELRPFSMIISFTEFLGHKYRLEFIKGTNVSLSMVYYLRLPFVSCHDE